MTEAEIAQRRIERLTETETYERRDALRAELEARGLSAVQRAELHLLEEACAQIDDAHEQQAADETAAESAWERAAEYDAENQAQLDRDDAQCGDPIPANLDEQWAALHASQVETFKRKLRNLEGAFRRLDSGELTGRNATGSDATRRMHYEQLRDLARIDAVCDALDADEKLAARWNRIERRSVGASA